MLNSKEFEYQEDDDRCQPGAYVRATDPSVPPKARMYRIVRITRTNAGELGYQVWLEDCFGYDSTDPDDINRRHKADNGYCFREFWLRPDVVKSGYALVLKAPAKIEHTPVAA
jgi:hypothetical protein